MTKEAVESGLLTEDMQEYWRELARVSYAFYCEYAHRGSYTPAKHTKLICDKLEAVERGEIKRVMFMMPPRHSKSMTCSETFPSWFLGKNPERRVIEISYGDMLAKRFGRLNKQKIVECGEELFGVIMPRWGLGMGHTASATDWGLQWTPENLIKHDGREPRGGMISRGIGGAITGEGASLMLIDDPIKNREEADSEVYRNRIWDEYQNTLLTRLAPDGAIILILTRWHEDDLAGRILQQEKDWDVVCLPCIAEELRDKKTGEVIPDILGREEGQALWPEYGFDEAWATDKKDKVGSRVWLSLYQQKPTAAVGTRYQRGWWQFYKELPEYDIKVQSWDTGLKKGVDNDPSNCQTWVRCKNGYYLVDRWNNKVDFPTLVNMMKALYAKHNLDSNPVNIVYVEEATSGYQAMQTLKNDTQIPMITIPPKSSKESRADAVSPLIEAGKVFLPDPYWHSTEKGVDMAWVSDFLDEWSSFPLAAHDEDVDVASLALNKLQVMSGSMIHTSDQYREEPDREIIRDQFGDIVHVETKEGTNGNGHKDEEQIRYQELVRRHDYFDEPYKAQEDFLLETSKEQGYLPIRCLLAGYIAMDLLRARVDPCSQCDGNREVCGGRPIAEDVVMEQTA